MKPINSMFGSWCADCGADLTDGSSVCPGVAEDPHPSWPKPMTVPAASLPEPPLFDYAGDYQRRQLVREAAEAAFVTACKPLYDRIAELEAAWSMDTEAGIEWQSRAHKAQSRIDQLLRDLAAIEERFMNLKLIGESIGRGDTQNLLDMVRAAQRGDTP